MVADVLELEWGARADLALEARAPVDNGVVAEEGEGEEECCRRETAGATERRGGDEGLDADDCDGQRAVHLGCGGIWLGVGEGRRGLEIAEQQCDEIRKDKVEWKE